jgi:diacylglycerol O-acyltransferase
MSLITQLSREDVMFVAGETDRIYQHVAVLSILDASDRPEFDFEHFRQHCSARAALIPHFRWKLHSVPMGLDRPYWVEDENFSFDHHIKHIALPRPGDKETLCEVASLLYARHLDRSRPLWEMWLIEGLEDGRYAYLQKFHHCMMDGEGAFKMMEIICDFEAEPSQEKVVDKSISEARAGKVPTVPERSTKAWAHLARLPGEAAKNMYDILRPKVLEQFVWPRKPPEERPVVPTARFNGSISSDRAMTYVSLAMAQLKVVKTHFSVSLNDVVLALVSSATRSYLLDHDELPAEPLRTNIPVSLRSDSDDQLSNKVTNTTVTLATDLDDPVARLRAINEESERAKVQAHSGGIGVIEMFQMMPPIMVSTIMESLPDDQAPQILGANLIISNVRGSPVPMYIAGARIDEMYPMSILTAGVGINYTCISYQDQMDFGIVVDPNLMPQQHTLATRLEAALGEYLALCKPAPKRRAKKKGVVKPKAKAKRRPAKKSTTVSTAKR